jgi:GeoRSP system SPASM domain protein
LPNAKIGASFRRSAAERLSPGDVERLKVRLGPDAAARRAGVSLEIHDLFLWEILYPAGGEGRGEYGGCQAADSLGHVDADGWLHPCSSWPLRLGSLLERGVAEIWASPGRMAVRGEIAAVPAACLGCRDYPLCLGGCRGLAKVVNDHPDGRDPLCPAPR